MMRAAEEKKVLDLLKWIGSGHNMIDSTKKWDMSCPRNIAHWQLLVLLWTLAILTWKSLSSCGWLLKPSAVFFNNLQCICQGKAGHIPAPRRVPKEECAFLDPLFFLFSSYYQLSCQQPKISQALRSTCWSMSMHIHCAILISKVIGCKMVAHARPNARVGHRIKHPSFLDNACQQPILVVIQFLAVVWKRLLKLLIVCHSLLVRPRLFQVIQPFVRTCVSLPLVPASLCGFGRQILSLKLYRQSIFPSPTSAYLIRRSSVCLPIHHCNCFGMLNRQTLSLSVGISAMNTCFVFVFLLKLKQLPLSLSLGQRACRRPCQLFIGRKTVLRNSEKRAHSKCLPRNIPYRYIQ